MGLPPPRLSMRSGPLPPPSHFEHYERMLPGAAERIFATGESEQAARHEIEAHASRLEMRETSLGVVVWFGILVAVVFLAWIGHTTVAGILAGGIGVAAIPRLVTAIGNRNPPT